jgi:hypothetical protein
MKELTKLDCDIITFMTRYWERYPAELERDHPLPVILQMSHDYQVYLEYGVFMIYTERNDNTYLLYYAFDYQENLRRSVKAHYAFTKDRMVYIPQIKDFYKSPIRSHFDEEKQLWRFL